MWFVLVNWQLTKVRDKSVGSKHVSVNIIGQEKTKQESIPPTKPIVSVKRWKTMNTMQFNYWIPPNTTFWYLTLDTNLYANLLWQILILCWLRRLIDRVIIMASFTSFLPYMIMIGCPGMSNQYRKEAFLLQKTFGPWKFILPILHTTFLPQDCSQSLVLSLFKRASKDI